MIPQYAGVGETCPVWQVQVSGGGNLSPGTLYFSFALQNRAGFNRPSVSGAIAYSTNQKIVITIPASVSKPGWDIHYYVLSAGTTSDPSTHVQIVRVPGYQYGAGISPQSIKTSLPVTIELSRDAHIALAPSVANLANLPSGVERLDGQVRWVTAEAKWYEYRSDSSLSPGVDVLATDIGRWVRIGSASSYVANTRAGVGSDRDITSINPISVIPTPSYPGASSGAKILPAWEAQYWLYNNASYVLPSGTEFGIDLEYEGLRSPDLLNGLFMVKFIGFVKADGSIRTSDTTGRAFSNTGAFFPWTPKLTSPFITSDDLQPGEAIVLAIKPYFSVVELNNQVVPGATISVLPIIRTQSGDYNPMGKLLPGGAVFNLGDRYRVVPSSGLSIDILAGAAIVGSFDFPTKPRRTVGGLSPNTANQKVVINGNGAVYIESSSYIPTSSEQLRALVGTVSGESTPGAWSNYLALSGQGVKVTLSYSSSIRSNYPDVVKSTKGFFNPPRVNIYLQRQDTGQIRKFTGFGVIAGATQEFTINDWNAGTIVASLPDAAANFSLWGAGSSAIAAIPGNFAATDYRACYTFNYDGNQVTSISHASPPCIQEWEGDFQPPSIAVGSVTTLLSGSAATVVNSGNANAAIFDFGIPAGASATVAVGTTTTGAAGSNASVTNSGTSSAAILNFSVPAGAQGPAGASATVAVGTTTTGAAGSNASVTNSGTSSAAILNFTIPTGAQGPAGPAGSVSSSTGALILDSASLTSAPSTSSSQIAIWNNSDILSTRAPSSGEIREVGDRTIPTKLFLISFLS